jgi:hypothetical protein
MFSPMNYYPLLLTCIELDVRLFLESSVHCISDKRIQLRDMRCFLARHIVFATKLCMYSLINFNIYP